MIAKRVAFVLRLIDDFNGIIIQRQKFTFEIDGFGVKPIEKEEGLFVFAEPIKENVEVQIISGYYHACTIKVEKGTLDEKEPVAEVRLFRKPGIAYSPVISYLSGRIEDKNVTHPVHVCVKSSKSTGLTFKEIREEEDGMYLICNGFTKEITEGKTFCMTNNDKTDIFVIYEKKGVNGYKIKERIAGNYDPGTPIERIYRSITDGKGNYSIPVNADEQDKITEVLIL